MTKEHTVRFKNPFLFVDSIQRDKVERQMQFNMNFGRRLSYGFIGKVTDWEVYIIPFSENAVAESSNGRRLETAFNISFDISNVTYFSSSANNGFPDLIFNLSIPKGVSVGAADVLEVFDPAGQVGVHLQLAHHLPCFVRLLPSRVTHCTCKEEIRPGKDDV